MRVRLGLFMALSLPLLFACPMRAQTEAPTAADAGTAAKALFTQGKYDDAIASYRQVQSDYPSAAADAQRMIGVCYQWKKDYTKAMTAYRSLLIDYPESEAAGEAYYWLGLCDEAQGNIDLAIADFGNQVKYFPTNARTPLAMLKAGERYQEKGQYDEALKQFNQVLTAAPANAPRAHLLIGICYQTQKKYKEAILAFKTGASDAASTGDTLREMKYRLQECYQSNGSFDDAAALAKTLATDYPADAARHEFNAGVAYQAKGDYTRAVNAYNDVILGHSSDLKANEARLRIDEVLRAQKKYTDELAYLQSLYVEVPDLRADSLTRQAEVMSECLTDLSNVNGAIDKLRQVIREFPDNPLAVEAQARIGAIQVHNLRDFAAAEAGLRDFMAKYPDYPALMVVAHDLAYCSYHQQNYGVASALFSDATKLKPVGNYIPTCLYMEADCYMRTGDFTKAKVNADLLISNYPDESWAAMAKINYANLTGAEETGDAK